MICLLSHTFFPLPFFFISSFVAHFIVFLLHGFGAGQPFRKGTNLIFKEQKVNSEIGSGFCDSVRIGQNTQNKVSLESTFFADVVAD